MTHTAVDTSPYTPSGSPAAASPVLLADVQRTFSDVTRYPVEILEPDANLEEDLGVDSVKLGEIFAALREKFDLPPMSDIKGRLEPDRLRTIAGIAGVVTQFRGTGGSSAAEAPVAMPVATPVATPPEMSVSIPTVRAADAPTAAPAAAAAAAAPTVTAPSAESLLGDVQRVFADVTRYPVEILEPDANLEEELGVDSVKLGEIFAVLRARWTLPPMSELRGHVAPERLRTIGGIVGVIAELGASAAGAPAAASTESATEAPADRTGAPRRRSAAGVTPHIDAPPSFKGRTALVVGGDRGLGRDVARHLTEHGATVVAAFDEMESTTGDLDFFVHCAPEATRAPVDRITADDWDEALRASVVALHRDAVRAARRMGSRGGRIVALSTRAGNEGAASTAACQGTVAAAVAALARHLAAELAPQHVRVNCIEAPATHGDAVWAMLRTLLSDDLGFVTGSVVVLDGERSTRM